MIASSDLPDYQVSANLGYCWYINTPCNISSKPNLGLLKVAPFFHGQTQPLFDTTMSAADSLTVVMNFIYSWMNIRQTRFQAILFKRTGIDNNYYYHLFITSSDPIALDFYDFSLIGNSTSTALQPVTNGHMLLLNGGFMNGPSISNYLNYAQEVWVRDNNGPSFVTSPSATTILQYFSSIAASVQIANEPFFNDVDIAFFTLKMLTLVNSLLKSQIQME